MRTKPSTLLTPPECGEYLSLDVRTLANWRCDGRGPPFRKIGGRVRYALDDLERWMRSRTYGRARDYRR